MAEPPPINSGDERSDSRIPDGDPAAGPAISLVATDLDGTLLGSDRTLAESDAEALRALGEAGVVRVVATGRSLHAAELVLRPDVPIDYLVVSSGAGIVEWSTRRLLALHAFAPGDVARVARVLDGFGLDFMGHARVPRDHHFRYVRNRAANADLDRRVGRYGEFARPCVDGAREFERESGQEFDAQRDGSENGAGEEVSQFVAILEPGEVELFEQVRAALPEFSVLRCTSPLDGRSLWVEVRPAGVTKATAVARLATRHRLGAEQAVSVGNDYNDGDLLAWSRLAFVVGNAAPELRERYPVVASNDAAGFSDMVRRVGRHGGGFMRAAPPVAE